MEAKDTIILYSGNKQSIEIYLDALLAEQAETSFHAGMRKVVEWVDEDLEYSSAWQEKKKEWGLKDKKRG